MKVKVLITAQLQYAYTPYAWALSGSKSASKHDQREVFARKT